LKMSEDRYRYANLLAHKGVMFGNWIVYCSLHFGFSIQSVSLRCFCGDVAEQI
jgi:hypothetical protein